MITFIGEHTGKLDAKGRVPLPSQFKRQLNKPDESLRFVLKKSNYKQCIELHPLDSWQAMMAQLTKKLNPIFNKKHNIFLTQFSKGTVELSLDGIGRLLISKNLLDFATLDKDVVFLGVGNIIELWDKQKYDANESMLPTDEFEQLAEDIFGDTFNLYE
ncbi:MAG TPA: division/cell wall cluster transcriptional repressor MraZ [Bacteroidales bacterium]|nr:MAG: cell division protein MraZ [Bacteroidetes bacterium ADurb.Bin217]HPM12784.1 division/cell wall cluster transcriptional repressor MraZ [Bacteroidales bacterium]